MDDVEVVIIGAGVAGLAAAHFLARRGARIAVLEALPRAGGRAFTDHPAALAGAVFDHGASWLHHARRNPLARLGQARGETLIATTPLRQRRVMIEGRIATRAELDAYDAAADRLEQTLIAQCAADERAGRDRSFAAALDMLPPDPWWPNLETREATLIAAADPARLSLRDWRDNLLEGENLLPPGGLGALALRLLAPPPGTLHLATQVRRLTWDTAQGVAAETARGTLNARSAIVTVSTGVLAAERIHFHPRLPMPAAEAIAALPMGLLSKIAWRAITPERFGLPPSSFLERRLAVRGEPYLGFNAWPLGRDHLVGFFGGPLAWNLARAAPAAVLDFARAELAHLLGAGAPRHFAAEATITGWGSNPAFLGAYAYALPGATAARHALAEPLAEGRLCFAGEACHPRLAGTLAGAFESGRAAARVALSRLRARREQAN